MPEPRADLAGSRALLIGTGRYRDQSFSPLPAALNSVGGMRDMLVDPALGGWHGDQVDTVLDPEDPQDLVLRIRETAMATTGTLLLYYCGHGELTPRAEPALTVVNTVYGHEDVTGVEYARIRDALLDSPARVKIVILDCCYSRKAPASLSGASTAAASVAGLTEISGACTLTAAEYAAHVVPLPEQEHAFTSFTGELLDLVREGFTGGPPWLTLGVLYPELRRRLHMRGLPEPGQRGSDTVHEFPFVRNAMHQAAAFPAGTDPAPQRDTGVIRMQRPAQPMPAGGGRHAPLLIALSVVAIVVATAAVTALVVRAGQGGGTAAGATPAAGTSPAAPAQPAIPADTTRPPDCPPGRMCFYGGPNFDGSVEIKPAAYDNVTCHPTHTPFRSVFNGTNQSQVAWTTKDCKGERVLIQLYSGKRSISGRSYWHD